MNEPQDPNLTVDNSSAPSDSLEAGLAAGFGVPSDGPQSVLAPLTTRLGKLRPVLLRDAEGDSNHVVRPKSDAMPTAAERGDRYQLAGEIARGGMGAVLRGRDVDLGRDLAVKVLLERHAHRPEVVRRFLEEAQIGGQLQHPGVVPVYDIGRFGERPFFTMKLVKGQTLAALLAARPDASADRPRLLGIALQVAQTVAYAHAKGVIHRDLKPANVMVGAFGEVQVMDWGLAKVLAEGGVADEERATRQHQEREDVTEIRTGRSGSGDGDTEAGSLLGTPAYMPPEQANGDVIRLDRRADVFGLGAVLCEILSGKPPYVGRSSEEVRRKAANGDLAEAYTRLDGCGADAELTALVKSCLAAEAIDRPQDARAVADALAEYLNGVQARLHKAELAEAAAEAKAVTLGGGSWLWLKSDREARQAALDREVSDALTRGAALREQAKAATVGGAALFAQAREQAQRALALTQGGPAGAELQAQAVRLRAGLDEDEKDQTLLAALDSARLAEADRRFENRFAVEQPYPLLREAFRAYGTPIGEGDPDAMVERIKRLPDALQQAVVTSLDRWIDMAEDPRSKNVEPNLDWLKKVAAKVETADPWLRRMRVDVDEKNKAKRRAALEKLAKEPAPSSLPPAAFTRLANKLSRLDADAAAIRVLKKAVERHPADYWINHDLGVACFKVNPAEADDAVRYLSAAAALRPQNSEIWVCLGYALRLKGRLDDAVDVYRKGIDLDPKSAIARSNLAITLFDRGDVDEATAVMQKAVELDPKNVGLHRNLSFLKLRTQKLEEPVAKYRRMIELKPNSAADHWELGRALLRRGKSDEALESFRDAVRLDGKHVGQAIYSLADQLKARGDVDGALAWYRKAVELEPENVEANINLGVALKEQGRLDEAIECLRRAGAVGRWETPGGDMSGIRMILRAKLNFDWTEEIATRQKLAAYRDGSFVPANSGDRLKLIKMCLGQLLFKSAAELYADGFAANSELIDVEWAGHRFQAARAAVMAAAGLGFDDVRLDEPELTRLRRQALDWLKAELQAWAMRLDKDATKATAVVKALKEWQEEPDLAGVREEAALPALTPEERAAWTQLWKDVATLRKKAEAIKGEQKQEAENNGSQ
jgi:serine/threonine-protein kinase